MEKEMQKCRTGRDKAQKNVVQKKRSVEKDILLDRI